MTIERLYKNYIEQLKSIYEEREATNITDCVFESIAGIKRSDRILNKQIELQDLTIQLLKQKLQELLQHMPLQYVLEEAWFYKMKFFVNENVLIPRPETEELVAWVVKELNIKNKKIKIVDIGTGSGCIAIALKKELNEAAILAIDVSAEALSVARQNAVELRAHIEFLQTNFLDETKWYQLPSVDIIVSNPPYIPEKEKIKMAKNVVGYEPHLALFVKDRDPFIFYKKIALFAQLRLNEDGKIYVEVHEDCAKNVNEIFLQYNFKTIIKKDIYGRDRMISAHK